MKILHFIIIIGLMLIGVALAWSYTVSREMPDPDEIPVPIENPSAPNAEGEITLKLNQKVTHQGTSITAFAILEDSRCPSDVQCIQAGRATVGLNVETAMGFSSNEVAEGQSITTETLKITVVSITPYPISTRKTQDGEYRITLSLTPHNPSVVTPPINPPANPPVTAGCFVGGCSSQICSDTEGMASTCEWTPRYACYKQAKCERQVTGECGWTETAELRSCIMTAEEESKNI